jgi:hypothetical protein
MPRYEYIDHEGGVRVITATGFRTAVQAVWGTEYARTGSLGLADRAAGTVELSDERSRAA